MKVACSVWGGGKAGELLQRLTYRHWVGWKYNVGGGLVSSMLDITSLSVIKSGGGYGVDGDSDGKADPWNLVDSIFTAANYLSSNKFSTDARRAIWHYNHADWYVDKVVRYAEQFHAAASYSPADGTPPLADGEVTPPTTGSITSVFGWDTLSDGSKRWHDGIDIGIGGRSKVPIVSVADGKVVRSYLSDSYGNCVIISHTIGGKTYESLYAHLENRTVKQGQTVKKGQFLGYMGNTGKSFGAHLHFEMHEGSWNVKKTNAVDPRLFVQIPSA